MSKYEPVFKNATIELVKGHDGYWLWDEVVQMNVAVRAKTEQEAFVHAIEYYQHRFRDLKETHRVLKLHVDNFVGAVRPEDDDDDD